MRLYPGDGPYTSVMRSQRSNPFEIESSTITPATPEAIRDKLLRPATWPAWQMEILSTDGPEIVEEGDVVQGRAQMLGFKVVGQSFTRGVGETRFVEDVVVGVGMRITYTLEAVPGGTRVVHRLESDLPTGAMGRLLTIFLRRRLKVMQRVLLERLSKQAEG